MTSAIDTLPTTQGRSTQTMSSMPKAAKAEAGPVSDSFLTQLRKLDAHDSKPVDEAAVVTTDSENANDLPEEDVTLDGSAHSEVAAVPEEARVTTGSALPDNATLPDGQPRDAIWLADSPKVDPHPLSRSPDTGQTSEQATKNLREDRAANRPLARATDAIDISTLALTRDVSVRPTDTVIDGQSKVEHANIPVEKPAVLSAIQNFRIFNALPVPAQGQRSQPTLTSHVTIDTPNFARSDTAVAAEQAVQKGEGSGKIDSSRHVLNALTMPPPLRHSSQNRSEAQGEPRIEVRNRLSGLNSPPAYATVPMQANTGLNLVDTPQTEPQKINVRPFLDQTSSREFLPGLSAPVAFATSTAGAPVQSGASNQIMANANATLIAEASLSLRDTGGKIDVTLSPEDLGRLTVKIEHTNTGTLATLYADRPDTQDLLRRHADLLERQFQAMGFEQMTFEFGQNGQHQGARDNSSAFAPDTQSNLTSDTDTQHITIGASRAGLDVRI